MQLNPKIIDHKMKHDSEIESPTTWDSPAYILSYFLNFIDKDEGEVQIDLVATLVN